MDALRPLREGPKLSTLTNLPQVARDPPSTCGRGVTKPKPDKSEAKKPEDLTPEVKAKIAELSKGFRGTAAQAVERIRQLQAAAPGMTAEEAAKHVIEYEDNTAKPDKPQPSIKETLDRAIAGLSSEVRLLPAPKTEPDPPVEPEADSDHIDAKVTDAEQHVVKLQLKALDAVADYYNFIKRWLPKKPDIPDHLRNALIDNAQTLADRLYGLSMDLRKDDDETDAVQAAADRAEAKAQQVH
jgi:hypothetical protein